MKKSLLLLTITLSALTLNATALGLGNKELSFALKNHSCGKVTRSMFMGADAEGMLYYSARCNNRSESEYVVQVDTNSPKIKTRILECSIVEMLGIKCFKLLDS